MHVVVAVKQVPSAEALALGPDGRLSREGVALEMSAYCRRALAKGIELARATGGRCSVVSLGPPSAERVLREALACGADEAILLSDPALAGSDTLVTARALAALVQGEAAADLVLVGKASLDAETGQVGPQLAELLGFPFAGAVRALELDERAGTARVRCEQDDGGCELVVALPAVLALAERSCRPAKAAPGAVDAVAPGRVIHREVRDLAAAGPWGDAGSPTRVEGIVPAARQRGGVVCAGSVPEQVAEALRLLCERSALTTAWPMERALASSAEMPPPGPGPGPGVGVRPAVAVLVEPGRDRLAGELLGAAARLAGDLGGSVAAVVCEAASPEDLWSRGADTCLEIAGAGAEEDVAGALATWAFENAPQIVLAPATSWGREVAARAAARLGAGLVADSLDLEVSGGRLRCVKPACGGGALATVTVRSPIQMATVRPGVLPLPSRRPGGVRPEASRVSVAASGRVAVISRWRDDDVEDLERAEVVVGVGLGVSPDHYGEVRRLAARLGAELGATRKVADRALMPRARQIGITGRNIAPRLYVALGVGGSPHHLAGVRRAGTVLAVNADPAAPVFAGCDVGIVGDWREVAAEVLRRLPAPATPRAAPGPARR